MSSDRKKQLVENLITEIRFTSVNSVMFSQAIADKVGIHSTDNECLDLLILKGPLTAGELSKLTGLTTGSITAVIDRLEKSGYAKREFDKKDRRKVNIVPSVEKIEKEISIHPLSLAKKVAELIDKYSEKEIKVLIDFLSKANNLVGEEIETLRK